MPTISPARTLKLTSSKMSPSDSFSTSSTGLPASPLRSGKICGKRPADHGVDQAFLVEFGDRARQHAAAILQHHDLVGDGIDFLEPVRDVEDGRAGGGEAAHLVEQLGGFGGGDHRGRLVEDQDLRFGDERLGDFDDLLARDAERADQRRRIDLGEAEIGKHARGDAVRLRPVDDEREPARRHAPEQHVFRDAEMRQQRLSSW